MFEIAKDALPPLELVRVGRALQLLLSLGLQGLFAILLLRGELALRLYEHLQDTELLLLHTARQMHEVGEGEEMKSEKESRFWTCHGAAFILVDGRLFFARRNRWLEKRVKSTQNDLDVHHASNRRVTDIRGL
jgi:hypothetical protein